MEIESAVGAIKRLQGFFGKKLPPEALEFYLSEFRLLPENVFNASVSECMRTERAFPTPTVLKNYVVSVRQRMEDQDRSRNKVKTFADFARANPGDPECIQESKKLLARIALPCGHTMHLCGDDLIAEMRVMEKAFQGRGWGENAAELENCLSKQRQAVKENQRKDREREKDGDGNEAG